MRTITQEEFRAAIETIRVYKEQLDLESEQAAKVLENIPYKVLYTPETPFMIGDSGVPTRLYNAFRRNFSSMPEKIGDLEGLSIQEISKCKGVGSNTIKELMEICKCAGVSLVDDSFKPLKSKNITLKPKREKRVTQKEKKAIPQGVNLEAITHNTLIAKSGLAPISYWSIIRYLYYKGIIPSEARNWEYDIVEKAKMSHLKNIHLSWLKKSNYGAGKKTIEDIKKICNHLNIPYIE